MPINQRPAVTTHGIIGADFVYNPMKISHKQLGLLRILAVILSSLLIALPAHAANFVVNSGEDLADLEPGNGLCVAYILFVPPFYVLPFCTLRAAIQEANALGSSNSIQLQEREYILQHGGTGEDLGATGDLDITGTLSLVGAGVGQTVINGNKTDRVFDIHAGASGVLISNLTISHGQTSDSNSSGRGGGGVRNRGGLTLRSVSITENSARILGVDRGGGLYNQGVCTVEQSTVSGNSALLGGGMYNDTGGTLTVRASAIYQNGSNDGGGLYSRGTADLINTTISGNRAEGDGGGLWNQGNIRLLQATVTDNAAVGGGAGIENNGHATLSNTIIAKNTGSQCGGRDLASSGGNLAGDAECLGGSRLASDLVGRDPQLGALADNGGSTPTHALYYTSPAVNQGLDCSPFGITADQRGMRRPLGGRYDIGAFEAAVPVIPFVAPLLFSR